MNTFESIASLVTLIGGLFTLIISIYKFLTGREHLKDAKKKDIEVKKRSYLIPFAIIIISIIVVVIISLFVLPLGFFSDPSTAGLSPDKLSEKADELLAQEQYTKALETCDKILAIDNKYADAYFQKAIALHKLNRFKEAKDAYKAYLDINPNNDIVWQKLGNSYNRMHEWDEAINCYDKAIQLSPTVSEYYVSKGWLLKYMSKYDESIKTMEQALDCPHIDDDQSYKCYLAIAEDYYALQNYDKGLDKINKALKYEPKNGDKSDAYNVKSQILRKLGRDKEADEYQQKVKDLAKDN